VGSHTSSLMAKILTEHGIKIIKHALGTKVILYYMRYVYNIFIVYDLELYYI
jgi:hypothetical protein